MTKDDKLTLDAARKQAEKLGHGSAPNDHFEEPKSHLPINDASQPFYESDKLMIKDFNRFFIQTLLGGVPYVIWEHDDEDTFFTYENFHKQFSYVKIASSLFGENNKVESNIKPTKCWLDNYHKRSCKGIKFWPSTKVDPKDPDGKYHNTWKGWAVKPVEDEILCRVAREYLFEVLCWKNKSKYRHLLDFLSHMFQFPEVKPTYGLALKSEEEGSGKSELSKHLMLMIGLGNSANTSNPNRIFGAHNGILNNCILLSLGEVEWALYKQWSNQLRDLFTVTTLIIDEKHLPPFKQNSFTRIIIDGNADHIMFVSRTARRLTIYTVNPVYVGNTKYWKQFNDVMNNGGREALMHFLLNREISQFFDPFKPLYTKEVDDEKESSLDPVSEFWLEEYLEKAVLPYDHVMLEGDLNGPVAFHKVIVEKLTWCFNDWQKSRGERAQLTSKAFSKRFRRIVPEMPEAWKVKHQPDWLGRQLNCFKLPSIRVCRAFFVEYQNWKHKTWSDATKFEQTYVDKSLWYKER
jgi:hypothetical protein